MQADQVIRHPMHQVRQMPQQSIGLQGCTGRSRLQHKAWPDKGSWQGWAPTCSRFLRSSCALATAAKLLR